LLSTLNWRRDPGYEQRMLQFEQRKMRHELRMRQLESEIEQIEKETEQHCFPDESNSTPLPPTEPGSSSPSP
jgi:hypothetical protein